MSLHKKFHHKHILGKGIPTLILEVVRNPESGSGLRMRILYPDRNRLVESAVVRTSCLRWYLVVAGGRAAGGRYAVPRWGRAERAGARWMHWDVQAVSHEHQAAVAAISARTRSTQLRHSHLLPRAHQHLQDAARRQEKVNVTFVKLVLPFYRYRISNVKLLKIYSKYTNYLLCKSYQGTRKIMQKNTKTRKKTCKRTPHTVQIYM